MENKAISNFCTETNEELLLIAAEHADHVRNLEGIRTDLNKAGDQLQNMRQGLEQIKSNLNDFKESHGLG